MRLEMNCNLRGYKEILEMLHRELIPQTGACPM